MASVEWNKKEELVAEQALKHLKTYSPLLAAVAKSAIAELSLLVKIQEYCYDNMNFMKSFQKIVVMLYKSKQFHCLPSLLDCFICTVRGLFCIVPDVLRTFLTMISFVYS